MGRRLDFVQGSNAAYVEEQFRRYRENPDAVSEEWALFFAGFDLALDPARAPSEAGPAGGGAFALVQAYRAFGHRLARLDPLGLEPPADPLLDLAAFGLSEADLDREAEGHPFRGEAGPRLRDLIEALRDTYCGTLGVEFTHLSSPAARDWLIERMEPSHNRAALEPGDRERVLEGLLEADRFEEFLHVRYPG